MPKFGDYFFTALIGFGGVVLFTGILIIVWIADVFFGFLPESWNIKPVTDNFKLVWLVGSSIFFLFTIRTTWKDQKSSRSCSTCNAEWTIEPTGESEVLNTDEVWRQEERTEKKYKSDLKPSGWYARSVFMDVLYEITSLEDIHKCSNCAAITKRPRTSETKLREDIKSATPWQPAQSNAEIGAKIGRKMV